MPVGSHAYSHCDLIHTFQSLATHVLLLSGHRLFFVDMQSCSFLYRKSKNPLSLNILGQVLYCHWNYPGSSGHIQYSFCKSSVLILPVGQPELLIAQKVIPLLWKWWCFCFLLGRVFYTSCNFVLLLPGGFDCPYPQYPHLPHPLPNVFGLQINVSFFRQ